MLGRRLGLVQPSQAAVVALVQTPGAMHRKPHLIDALQHQPQRPDGPLQHRRVAHIELITCVCRGERKKRNINTGAFYIFFKTFLRFLHTTDASKVSDSPDLTRVY